MEKIRLIDMKTILVDKKTDEWGVKLYIECVKCNNIEKFVFTDKKLVAEFFKDFDNNNVPKKYSCKKCELKNNPNIN